MNDLTIKDTYFDCVIVRLMSILKCYKNIDTLLCIILWLDCPLSARFVSFVFKVDSVTLKGKVF